MSETPTSQGSEYLYDPEMGVQVVNETTIPNDQVFQSLKEQHPELSALARWGSKVTNPGRGGGIFERDRYVTPANIFDQFKVALDASESDDVVSNFVETTEALAFNKVSMDAEDPQEEDIWNQIIDDIDIDARLREMWKETVTVSQFYAAVFWGNKTYKVQGKTKKGNESRKKFKNLRVPRAITILDPLKIVPVGDFMFGNERLAYIATRNESANIDEVLAGKNTSDLTIEQLIDGKYEPSAIEKKYLKDLTGANVDNLYLLKKDSVFRHTATRPGYQRFAAVRMKSVFEILDLKQQLRQMDRSYLIGGPLRTDQRVVTPDGWKMIGNMEVGDQVMGPDGKPTTVLGVYPQGMLDIYKVTFSDGAEVYCDRSHYWTVTTPDGTKKTITLGEMLDRGLKTPHGVNRFRVPISEPVELEEKDLALDPYLVGYMLGDGSFTQSGIKISVAKGEELPWVDCLPNGVHLRQYEKRGHDYADQWGIVGDSWRDNPVAEAIDSLGLRWVGCEDKFIPQDYLWGSVEQRFALLQGLLDSDGSVAGPGSAEFSSVSKELAENVVHLVQSLGGTAKIYERKPSGKARQVCYRVYLTLHTESAPFRLQRKINRWSPRNSQYVRAIVSVVSDKKAPAICIKVDREDGLFLTEGFVVTHNTNFILLVKKGSDRLPAKQSEVTGLANQVKSAARVPVIIGDHRIEVEIVTPKMDLTLKPERYNVLDARITSRLYQVFMTGNYAAGTKGDDSLKLSRVIARGMESRRHMIRQTLMDEVFKVCYEANDDLTSMPKLNFNPKRIALDFDATIATFMQDLRDRGDISRDTILSEMDLNQEEEASKRKREKELGYDKLFKPANTIPGAQGRRLGGNQQGGGANPDSFKPNPQNDDRKSPGDAEDKAELLEEIERVRGELAEFIEKSEKEQRSLEIDVAEHTEKLAELDYEAETPDKT